MAEPGSTEPAAPPRRTFVFAGPTLPRTPNAEWSQLLGRAELRPPAQRGDILNALCHDPHTLVLLDGYYFTVPSVTHKELLYALEAGIRIIGSASMGALRAAELHPFGMEGVGWVFEQFRDGHLDGDDEVAVLHATEDFQFRPLTVALVDVRDALLHLLEAGLETDPAEALIADLKALPFSQRHGHRIRQLARNRLGEPLAAALDRRLSTRSVKEQDALRALHRAFDSERPRREELEGAEGTSTATTFLGYFQEWHLEVPGGTPERRCTFRQAAHCLQVLHPEAGAVIRRLRRRILLAAAARRQGLEANPRRIQDLRELLEKQLRRLHGMELLPAPERLDEARSHALAEAAVKYFGSQEDALLYMASTLGLDAEEGLASLERLLMLQDDLLPAWWIARGLACTSAFPEVVTLAREAAQIHRAFQTWKGGARIQKADLEELAAQLWGCPRDGVLQEAGARGLFEAGGFSPGFSNALELVAAAERLPRAINEYPQARSRLRTTEVLSLLPPISPTL